MRKPLWVAAILFAATFILSAQVSYWFQGFQRQGDAAKARTYLGVGTNTINLTGSVAVAVGPKLTGSTNLSPYIITVSAPDMATTNDVKNATNGYPWGVLYDPAGTAQGATNGIPLWWIEAGSNIVFSTNGRVITIYGTTTNSAGGGVVDAGRAITVSTNGDVYTVATDALTNGQSGVDFNGLNVNGFGLEVGGYVAANDGAFVTLLATNAYVGGFYAGAGVLVERHSPTNVMFPVPVISASPSTNAPAADEFPIAGWVRDLLINGTVMYNTTNLAPGWVYGAEPYLYLTNIPPQFSRVYSSLTNNQYVGAVAITNQTAINGPFVVSAYLGTFGGSANAAITVRPEIYYSYDNGTNLLGDWDCQAQSLATLNAAGITNRYDWVIPVPSTTFSATATVYRVFRVMSVSGTPNKPSLVVCGGTNTPGQISFGQPNTVSFASASAVAPGANVTVATNGNVYTVSASTGGASGVSNFGMRRISFFEQDSYPGSFHTFLGMTPSVVGNNYQVAGTATDHPYAVFYLTTHNQCGVKDTYANFVPPNKSGLFRFVLAPTNTTNIRLWAGLVNNYGGQYIWDVQDPTTNRLAMFRLSTNSANWFFITCDGSTATATDTGVAATTSQVSLNIENTGASWIGTIGAVSVTNTTNLPDQPMCPLIELFNTDANAAGCKIWGYYGEQDW